MNENWEKAADGSTASDKPLVVKCLNCEGLLTNDDPAAHGKRIRCPKCGVYVRMPYELELLTERQLLAGIYAEIRRANRHLRGHKILNVILLGVLFAFVGFIVAIFVIVLRRP